MEEMEKKAGNAESEVSGLRSRLILLQVKDFNKKNSCMENSESFLAKSKKRKN